VIAFGNAYRSDDAAGLVVAKRLRERGVEAVELEGEPVALLDIFEGCEAAVLIDTVRSDAAPGTVRRFDLGDARLPEQLRGASSTHLVGVGEAIELARALDRLPPRVILFGVEGERFEAGTRLSTAVEAAVEPLVELVLAELGR
jgi:hydrogenase maturation protease